MEELILITLHGFSFAKILFTIGATVLLALFVALFVSNTVKLLTARKETIEYLDKLDNNLGIYFLTTFGYVLVVIILSYVFNQSLI